MDRRLWLTGCALAVSMTIVGCSSSSGDQPPAGSSTAAPPAVAASGSSAATSGAAASGGGVQSGDPAVRWADSFCAPIADLVKSASTQPNIDTSNPQAMRTSLAAFFGSIADQLGKTSTALKSLGPSPVSGGDQAAKALAAAYDKTRTAFLTTKQKLESTSDPNALAQVMSDIGPKMQELGASDPLKSLTDSKQLADAAKRAPHCQDIQVG